MSFARLRVPVARSARLFSTTRVAPVKVGDAIPDIELYEDGPATKVNLKEEFSKANGIIVGVPAAFSPACSASHVPGFIKHPKLKEAGKVFVVSVNDGFVMKAWQESLDPAKKSGIRFLGDGSGAFTRALELDFDSAAIFGNDRSKRYALVVENGKVTKAFVEPDNIGTTISLAENVLA